MIIHQTYKTTEIREDWLPYQASWKTHHPDCDYRFWTDEDNRELISTHYAWFLPIYDSYPYNIQRADVARYFMLHRHGGLYADLDYECLKPLDELLSGRDLAFTTEPTQHHKMFHEQISELNRMVSNALMYSTPGHPFWEKVFDLLKIKAQLAHDVLESTGPFLLTRANPPESSILPAQLLSPWPSRRHRKGLDLEAIRREAYAMHHWSNSWWDPANRIVTN